MPSVPVKGQNLSEQVAAVGDVTLRRSGSAVTVADGCEDRVDVGHGVRWSVDLDDLRKSGMHHPGRTTHASPRQSTPPVLAKKWNVVC